MGRSAHRKRTGAGPPTTSALIEITDATVISGTEATLTYSAAVTAAEFTPPDFESLPSAALGLQLTQTGPTQITVEYNADISTDTDVAYSGSVAGVLTPQTISYT